MEVRAFRTVAMSRLTLSLALPLLLTACATPTWSCPATTVVEFEGDNRACQHMNSRTVSISPTLLQTYVRPMGGADVTFPHGSPCALGASPGDSIAGGATRASNGELARE